MQACHEIPEESTLFSASSPLRRDRVNTTLQKCSNFYFRQVKIFKVSRAQRATLVGETFSVEFYYNFYYEMLHKNEF